MPATKQPISLGGPLPTTSPYDEAFDEGGQLRPVYASLRERLGWDPLRPPRVIAEQLRDRPLGDDARILPIPWAIPDAEYEGLLRPGIAQRARALQMFFADIFLGSGSFLAGGHITWQQFSAILANEGQSLDSLRRKWQSHQAEEIRFVLAPDLVRDPRGRWLILEDNVGCVGGMADSYFVLDAYARAANLKTTAADPCASDLSAAIQRWLARLASGAEDDTVLALLGCEASNGAPWSPRLLENPRRQAIMESLGIRTTDRNHLQTLWRDDAARRSLRALINIAGDAGDSREILDQVAFGKLHLPLLNAPGTGLLGNKALLPYVDKMIRFYLQEEPLLETPTTWVLTHGLLPDDPQHWVVKLSAGRQGTGVFVLSDQSPEQLASLCKLLQALPDSAAVAQAVVEPSRLSPLGAAAWDAYRLELRPVAYVLGWREVFVADQPLGKAVSNFDLRRLNNVSQGASYVAVIRVGPMEPGHAYSA